MHTMTDYHRTSFAIPALLLALFACAESVDDGRQEQADDQPVDTSSLDIDEQPPGDEPLASPEVSDVLPEEFLNIWVPWQGDLDEMVERRVIRVLVPFGGYQYYYVRGRPRGAIVELLQKMEIFLNDELKRRNIRVYVVAIPVSRDHLIRYLLGGHGDLVAADLTVTDERKRQVQFSRPILRDVNEVIVTGPTAPELASIDTVNAV